MSKIAILIPTLNRPGNLEPLVKNIRETTGAPHTIYFIAETGDTATLQTLLTLEHQSSIVGSFGSSAKAMNEGYRLSSEPYVFTGNDDLLFHEGWDTAALAEIDHTEIETVGTNDGHGRMTCFALCRRSYIKQHSGVYDKPNTLWGPYASQYCDTELADYAKHRGVWGEAPDSITEHLHPDFGHPEDSNYRKAQGACPDDHALYLKRRAAWEAA